MKLVSSRESLGLGQKKSQVIFKQRASAKVSVRSKHEGVNHRTRSKITGLGPISQGAAGSAPRCFSRRQGSEQDPRNQESSIKNKASPSLRCQAFSDDTSGRGRLGSPWEMSPLGQTSRIGKVYIQLLQGAWRYVPMILTQLAFIPLLYSYVTFSILEQVGLNVPRAFATLFANVTAMVSPALGNFARKSAGWLLHLPLNASDELVWKGVLQILLPLIPVVYFLFVMPLVDILVGRHSGKQAEFSSNKETDRRSSSVSSKGQNDAMGYRHVLWAFGIIYISLFSMSLVLAASLPNLLSLVTVSIGLGFYGAIAITVSHELLHSPHKTDRGLSKVLLSLVCYLHWQKAHTLVHHVRVATLEDPTSAFRGQNVYAFIWRSVFENFKILNAMETVDKATKASWIFVPLLLAQAFFVTCGPKGLALFLGSSVVAIVMLEIVNYIEHYGLERKLLPNGKYEQVSTRHSWNADWLFTNCHIINLQLHGDHHLNATRPYYKLKNINEGPQLPAPYSVMILLALVPPLWFHVMDRRIDEFQQKTA